MIPYDKFWPDNLDKALDYLQIVAIFDRSKLKFSDKNHSKGAELWFQKLDATSSLAPCRQSLLVHIFQDTYTIIGFCGVNSRVTPMCYGIVEGNNVAEN